MGYAAKLGSSGGSNLVIKTIGTTNSTAARTFNVTSILPDMYNKLTKNNFAVSNCYIATTRGGADSKNIYLINSYNNSTGVLSCSRCTAFTGTENWQAYIQYTIIAIYIE